MLQMIHTIEGLRFFELMRVYLEGNQNAALLNYPTMDKNAALVQAEQDFFQYLSDVFFQTPGAFYAVWKVSDQYICALRMEPYEDGLLLEGLETAPEMRNRGYATKLMMETLRNIVLPVYSHVSKDNISSLSVHSKCGFVEYLNYAKCIDGVVNKEMLTLRYCK